MIPFSFCNLAFDKVLRKKLLIRSLVFVLASFSGCASYKTDERLELLEARMDNQQVYDIRMGNLEERMNALETDIGIITSALPISKIKGSSLERKSQKNTTAKAVAIPSSLSGNSFVQTLPIDQSKQFKKELSISQEVDTIVDTLHNKQDVPLASITPLQVDPRSQTAPVRHVSQPQKIAKKSVEKGETSRYAAALKLYEQNKFNEAEKSFSTFLRDFPKSKLAPNAMYWFAECSYSKNDYATAVVNFKNVAAKYPKHDKAAAALYKLGLCYKKMNDMDNANFYWDILQSDFPMAEPTKLILTNKN